MFKIKYRSELRREGLDKYKIKKKLKNKIKKVFEKHFEFRCSTVA